MANGEDWLWRPMMAGLCKFESVIDGTLDLADLAVMNELIDIKYENEYRIAHPERQPIPPAGTMMTTYRR